MTLDAWTGAPVRLGDQQWRLTFRLVIVIQMGSLSSDHAAAALDGPRTASAWGVAVQLTRWMPPVRCLAVSCPFWDHGSTIATDAPTASIAGLVGVMTLVGWRRGFDWPVTISLAVATLGAISFRPSALYLIGAVCASIWLRPKMRSINLTDRVITPVRATAVYMIPIVIVLAAWCGWRGYMTGDFGLLPFGHINLAGVTIQLVDAQELRAIGPRNPVAYEILLNPRYRPRAGSTMELESRWDAQSYAVAAAAASHAGGAGSGGGDAVHINRVLGGLNRAIIMSQPGRYLGWVLMAIRRGIWGSLANLAMHPIHLIVGLGLVIVAIRQIVWPRCGGAADGGEDLCRSLFLLAVLHAACLTGFVALSSPAIGRLVDPGWIFVPVWAIVTTLDFLRSNGAVD